MSCRLCRLMRPASARRTVAFISSFVAALMAFTVASAALPAPVQVYYIPLPEDQVFTALSGIFPGRAACGLPEDPENLPNVITPIQTYISISIISADTLIYYDHWEDDFEIDLASPVQPSTQIWGDGNPANGAPPGIPDDLLTPDTVIVLDNPVTPATRSTLFDFDGGDKIGATRPIAISRAAWSTGPGTLLAGAVEVYDTSHWGTRYEAPVGENILAEQLFEYTGMAIMAQADDTAVQIDLNRDGTPESTLFLDGGESHLIDGDLPAGAVITASAPVQVTLITGDRCDIYESRWYALFPREHWSAEYYNPVSTPPGEGGTLVFLFNPDIVPLTVGWETLGGMQPSLTIEAGSVVSTVVPLGSGTRFFAADGRPFQAIAAIGADGPANANSRADWGFALVPERLLTYQVLVGWGAGRDPTSLVNPNENSSPVWVTVELPAGQTGPARVCIDYNGDGQGSEIDSNGFRYDTHLNLNRLQNAIVYDPDGDQTGMILYVCDPPAAPTGARIAAAWGQDPQTSSPDEPALDLGTTAPPASTFAAGKGVTVLTDRATDSGHTDSGHTGGIRAVGPPAAPGDTLRYAIVVRNASRVASGAVIVSDTVPLHTSYITSSTFFDNGVSVTPIADNLTGSPFPLDEGGVNLGAMLVRGVLTVTFDVRIDQPLEPTVDRVRNVALVTVGGDQLAPEVETEIMLEAGLTLAKRTNGEDADAPPGPILAVGAPVTWTYTLTNTGAVTLTNVIVTDSVPGVTPVYASGDNGDDRLAPNEVWTFQATGAAIAGQYVNVGIASATTPYGAAITASNPSRYFGLSSHIHLDKAASPPSAPSGAVITYTFTVTNGGNAALAAIDLSDDHCAPVFVDGDANGNTLLNPDETWRYRCADTVTVDITNTALVTGVDVLGRIITDTAQATVDVLTPAIALAKMPSATNVFAGGIVTYTFTVTNAGETALFDVALADDHCEPVYYVDGDINTNRTLEIDETWRYRCVTVIMSDTLNTATVRAVDGAGNAVTATASALVRTSFLFLPLILHEIPVECPPPDGCPIPGVEELKGLAVHPTTGVIYVTSRTNNRVLALDPNTLRIIASAETGDQPWGVAVDARAERVYVASFGGGDVRIYDAYSLAPLAVVPVGAEATLIEVLPELGAAFALVHDGSHVAVIEELTRTVILSSGGSGPFGIAADPLREQIYISNRDSAHFATVSRVTARTMNTWQTRSNMVLEDGRRLFAIAYDPAVNRLYSLYLAADGRWFVDTWKPEPHPQLWGREATVAVESSGAITSPLIGGAGLAINPATGLVYNANAAAGTVSVIERGGLRVLETITTRGDPFAIATDGTHNRVLIGLRASGRLIILR